MLEKFFIRGYETHDKIIFMRTWKFPEFFSENRESIQKDSQNTQL